MEEQEVKETQSEKHNKHSHSPKHGGKKHNNKEVTVSKSAIWQILCVLLVIALVVVILLNPKGTTTNKLSEEEIKTKTTEFVNSNLLQPGMTSSITSIEEDNGLYKMTIEVQGQQITSYMTMDGTVFFPQGLPVTEGTEPSAPAAQAQPAAPEVPKTDKPVVEMFVMSHCPYGTQIEKGMLPVVELLGDKADIQVKFVNYAMHGKTEVDEQLNQYCIQQEYPGQYFKYLQCFLDEGDTAGCISELGFDSDKLAECITSADKEFGISADFADQASWSGGRYPKFAIYDDDNKKYGVQGSPTLVVNGKSVSVGRDSNSLKNVICNAFNDAPEECTQSLPTASPSPGFGFGTSATDSAAAGCGV